LTECAHHEKKTSRVANDGTKNSRGLETNGFQLKLIDYSMLKIPEEIASVESGATIGSVPSVTTTGDQNGRK